MLYRFICVLLFRPSRRTMNHRLTWPVKNRSSFIKAGSGLKSCNGGEEILARYSFCWEMGRNPARRDFWFDTFGF